MEAVQHGLSNCRLTYLCWIPKSITHYKTFLHLFGKKARIVGTFKNEALIIHEEIFGSTPDFRLSPRPAMVKEIRNLIKEDQEQEEKTEIARLALDLDDRKHKYTKEQLLKFVQFKQIMTVKMGKKVCGNLADNVFCRFLDGYLFNFIECEKNMTDYLVSFNQ